MWERCCFRTFPAPKPFARKKDTKIGVSGLHFLFYYAIALLFIGPLPKVKAQIGKRTTDCHGLIEWFLAELADTKIGVSGLHFLFYYAIVTLEKDTAHKVVSLPDWQ